MVLRSAAIVRWLFDLGSALGRFVDSVERRVVQLSNFRRGLGLQPGQAPCELGRVIKEALHAFTHLLIQLGFAFELHEVLRG